MMMLMVMGGRDVEKPQNYGKNVYVCKTNLKTKNWVRSLRGNIYMHTYTVVLDFLFIIRSAQMPERRKNNSGNLE
jgi:hypothetical protein